MGNPSFINPGPEELSEAPRYPKVQKKRNSNSQPDELNSESQWDANAAYSDVEKPLRELDVHLHEQPIQKTSGDKPRRPRGGVRGRKNQRAGKGTTPEKAPKKTEQQKTPAKPRTSIWDF